MTTEEEAILRDQQLDLIYSQSGILYKIIHEEPRYNTYFSKPNPGSHANDVVGSVDTLTVESLAKQIHELSVKKSAVEEAKAATPSSQNVNVYSTLSTQKGTQQRDGKNNKGKKGEGNQNKHSPQTMQRRVKRRKIKSNFLAIFLRKTI